jgi:sulfoxide reductase heme-binding subunit YedZ
MSIDRNVQVAVDNYGWWLASRASGIAALVFLTVSIFLGLMMASKVMRRPAVRKWAVAMHEQSSLAAIFAITVHGITLIGDPWLKPGVDGVLIPFTMDYRPIYTGVGTIAGLLAIFLGLSFYIRRDIGSKLWRNLHRATVIVYAMAVVHTLGAGTDASAPWMRWWLFLTTPPIALLFVYRVFSATKRSRSRGNPAAPSEPGKPSPARASSGDGPSIAAESVTQMHHETATKDLANSLPST